MKEIKRKDFECGKNILQVRLFYKSEVKPAAANNVTNT